jgi:hypothetical protein
MAVGRPGVGSAKCRNRPVCLADETQPGRGDDMREAERIPMAVCTRCATQLPQHSQVCTGCGLLLNAPAAPSAPIPAVAAPVLPPVENPWKEHLPQGPAAAAPTQPAEPAHAPHTSMPAPATRYGIPQPVERPAVPIMPPNPFARGAQTDRGPLPPQMPVRHESAAIPVAFAQFSAEPAAESATPDAPAEVVVLRSSLSEALEAVIAELPEDAPEKAPEPFPEVLTIAPSKAAMPGWS